MNITQVPAEQVVAFFTLRVSRVWGSQDVTMSDAQRRNIRIMGDNSSWMTVVVTKENEAIMLRNQKAYAESRSENWVKMPVMTRFGEITIDTLTAFSTAKSTAYPKAFYVYSPDSQMGKAKISMAEYCGVSGASHNVMMKVHGIDAPLYLSELDRAQTHNIHQDTQRVLIANSTTPMQGRLVSGDFFGSSSTTRLLVKGPKDARFYDATKKGLADSFTVQRTSDFSALELRGIVAQDLIALYEKATWWKPGKLAQIPCVYGAINSDKMVVSIPTRTACHGQFYSHIQETDADIGILDMRFQRKHIEYVAKANNCDVDWQGYNMYMDYLLNRSIYSKVFMQYGKDVPGDKQDYLLVDVNTDKTYFMGACMASRHIVNAPRFVNMFRQMVEAGIKEHVAFWASTCFDEYAKKPEHIVMSSIRDSSPVAHADNSVLLLLCGYSIHKPVAAPVKETLRNEENGYGSWSVWKNINGGYVNSSHPEKGLHVQAWVQLVGEPTELLEGWTRTKVYSKAAIFQALKAIGMLIQGEKK